MPGKAPRQDKRDMMLTAPIEGLVMRMSVPTILSMLIAAFYNIADTYFVGQIDTISTASVGLALPVMTIVQAIGFLFGHGSGNYMARKLGEGDRKSSDIMSDTSVILCFISGCVIMTLCLLFMNPLVKVLGATPVLVEPATEYISIIMIGMPFLMTSFTMNNQLRFQGYATKGMIGMAIGSLLNVGLDPLLMFGFGMGLKGAAVATVIGQIVSFVILLGMTGRLKKWKPQFRPSKQLTGAIFRFGIPSLLRQGIMAVATICMNQVAGGYSEAAIAAMSIVGKILMVGGFIVIGLGQGFQPIVGFNSGAGKWSRVRKVYVFCMKTSTLISLVYGIVCCVFAASLVAFFRDDPAVIEAGTIILRFQSIAFMLSGMVVMTNMLLQNMGKAFTASFLALTRQGVFFIPLLYVLPLFFGIWGFYTAQAAADLLAFIVTVPFMIKLLRDLKKLESDETAENCADTASEV